MNTDDLLQEVRATNLNYLMLAQQMIRADKAMSVVRLGVSLEIADLLEGLSNAQTVKLAGSPSMLTRFRFDDKVILGMLTHEDKVGNLAWDHAAILLSSQVVEAIS